MLLIAKHSMVKAGLAWRFWRSWSDRTIPPLDSSIDRLRKFDTGSCCIFTALVRPWNLLTRMPSLCIMATSNDSLVLPNPYTPLAFLPPTLADDFQFSGYVFVAGTCVRVCKDWKTSSPSHFPTFQVFVWDWFMSIPDEYRLLSKTSFSKSNCVYLLSR